MTNVNRINKKLLVSSLMVTVIIFSASTVVPAMYESRANKIIEQYEKQDEVINYEFILNFAAPIQPLSTTNESPIYKYVNLTS